MAAVSYIARPSVGEKADQERWTRNGGVLMAELTDEELAELNRNFESCDLNGDGFIDREEFHSLLKELDGDVSREECLLDFEVADTEGDGYIGFKEFIVWWKS
jgi:Ca2+-binding EF-hand superfamily protein